MASPPFLQYGIMQGTAILDLHVTSIFCLLDPDPKEKFGKSTQNPCVTPPWYHGADCPAKPFNRLRRNSSSKYSIGFEGGSNKAAVKLHVEAEDYTLRDDSGEFECSKFDSNKKMEIIFPRTPPPPG